MWKSSSMSVNGVPHKKEGDEWVVDRDAYDAQIMREQAEQQDKDDLIWALRTRPLTHDEWEQVRGFGSRLLIRISKGMSNSYNQGDIEKQFNDLLLHQAQLAALDRQSMSAICSTL